MSDSRCTTGFVVYSITKDIIMFIMGVCAIIALHHHIKSRKRTSKVPRSLYCITIIFYVFTILYATGQTLTNHCYPIIGRYYIWFYTLCHFAWYCQMATLLLLLFMKLQNVFAASAYKLSQASKYIFWIMYIFYICSLAAAFSKLTVIIFTIVFLGLSTYLSTLFIYKLYQINAMSMKACENNLLMIITKSTILTTFCMSSSLATTLFYTYYALIDDFGEIILLHVWDSLCTLDISTNFLAVYLASLYAKKHYLLLCGKCDSFCLAKCAKHQKSRPEKELDNYIQNEKNEAPKKNENIKENENGNAHV
eukprot:398164_1